MATIEELLHRRTDLSTFLVHLTRDGDAGAARDNLVSIAQTDAVEARTAFGPAAQHERQLQGIATQKAVCFTETPLEHTWMMPKEIDGRRLQFQSYGIAITKTTARKSGFNPVWYSDITPGRTWPIAAVNTMVREAIADATGRDGKVDVELLTADPRFPLFRLTPFFEQMGPTSAARSSGGSGSGATSTTTGSAHARSWRSWHPPRITRICVTTWRRSTRSGPSGPCWIPAGTWSG